MGLKKISGKKYNGVYAYYKGTGIEAPITGYYIQYKDETNVTRTKKCDAINKDDALDILNSKKSEIRKIKVKIANGELVLQKKKANKSLTLNEYADMFHATRENRDAKQEKAMYHNHIDPELGKIKLAKITVDELIKFRKHLQGKVVDTFVVKKNDEKSKSTVEQRAFKPKTIKKILDYMRVILNNAIDDGYIEESPLNFSQYASKDRRIKEKKKIYSDDVLEGVKDVENARVLTDNELQILWELDELKMNDRLLLFLRTCYFTGARPAGVIDIQVKHIDFQEKKIKIKAMKQGKSYYAKITNNGYFDILKDWIVKYDLIHDNYIFFPIQSYLRANTEEEKRALKNKPVNYSGHRRSLQKIFDPAFNKGLDSRDEMNRVSVYSMRRTSSTKIYNKFGIIYAKKFLNHTDIKTTMRYLNIDDDVEDVVDNGL